MVKALLFKTAAISLLAALAPSLAIAATSLSFVDYKVANDKAVAELPTPAVSLSKAPLADDVVFLGYTDAEVNRNMCVGFDDEGESLQAIRLTASMLSPYAGEKLSGVRIGVGEEVENVTVFVRESLEGENLLEKTVPACASTWNYVKFDTPLTITGNTDLYVGYSYLHSGERYVIAADRSSFEPGSCYLGFKNAYEDYFDDYSSELYNFGKLLISAIVGKDISSCGNSLSLVGSDLGSYVQRDAPTDVVLNVFNTSWNEITSVEVTANIANETTTRSYNFDEALQPYQSATITWDDMVLAADGTVSFDIVSVNGVDNCATLHSFQQQCTVYEGEGFKRKLLLEQFTGQSCSNCPQGVEAIEAFIMGHEKDIIWVALHSFYLAEGFEDDYCTEAAMFYQDFFIGDVMAPMMMLNRAQRTLRFMDTEGVATITGVVIHPMYFAYANNYENFLDEEIATPARVSVVIEQDYDETSDVLNITVSGKKTEELEGEHVGLTLYVLEDGQVGYQSGSSSDYVHDNILRDVLTDFKGDVLEFDSDGYYEKTYSYEIPEEYVSYKNNIITIPNRKNMKIVAFVSAFEDNKNDCMVYNAEEQQLTSTAWSSDIDDVEGNSPLAFMFRDGSFSVYSSEDMTITVYNLMGTQLLNEGLTAGIYIVKAVDAAGNEYVTKMAVNE